MAPSSVKGPIAAELANSPTADTAGPAGARFLFVERGRSAAGRTVRLHSHPFWQLELFTEGRARMRFGHEERWFGLRDGILIPPGVAHGVEYADETHYL